MYDQFYGFTERPFQPLADPRFFVETATHNEALSHLDYGLAQGSGAIFIHGASGTGKSICAEYWLSGLDPAEYHILHLKISSETALSFAEQLSEALDLPDSFLTVDQWLLAVSERLRDEIWAGRRCLLVVDDVDLLTTEALAQLQLLAALHHHGKALMQIFLFGQSSFHVRMRQDGELASLRHMIGASHGLSILNVDEIEPYVYHRLSKVGWDDRPIFRQDAFAILLAETGAVPRRINCLLTRLLLNGALEEVAEIDAGHVAQAVAELKAEEKWEGPELGQPIPIFVPEYCPKQEMAGHAEPKHGLALQNWGNQQDGALAQNVQAQRGEAQKGEAFDAPTTSLKSCAEANLAEEIFAGAPMMVQDEAQHLAQLQHRIDELEAKVLEQEAAMRRMINLLLNWVEPDAMGHTAANDAALSLAMRQSFAAEPHHELQADLHAASPPDLEVGLRRA